MDIEKAKDLIKKENDHDFPEKNVVMRGLQILAKYEDNVLPQFDHDKILVSDFEKIVEQMSEEDVIQMAKLGWFYDKENDCWVHF